MSRRKQNKPAPEETSVVILNNYIRRHHVLVYKALEQRVGKLTILLSTEMEPDRSWEAEWNGLDVQVQKNLTYTSRWKHSSGFEEPNFIHFPIDTASRLKKLNPDVVFSYELGMRTLLSSWFRLWNRQIPLVMVGNMSEHIERERGFMRRRLRSILRRTVDYCTYNGPSCKRYLQGLGFSDDRLYHVPYCFDPDVAWQGEKSFSDEGPLKMVYCGSISSRKGITTFSNCLAQALKNSDRKVSLIICGEGALKDDVAATAKGNFEIDFRGNCDNEQVRRAYADADVCVFPTLADEWGLVPVEGMASGLPVLGSCHAQSIEVLAREGDNAWIFDPNSEDSVRDAISRCLQVTPDKLQRMSASARASVEHITPERSAEAFVNVIRSVFKTEKEDSINGVSGLPARSS